jgi:hypothetical protein
MTPDDIIDDVLKEFEKATGAIQEDLYKEITSAIKNLTLDAQGNIKPTIANIKEIKKITSKLEVRILNNPEYKKSVKNAYRSFNSLTAIQDQLTKKAFGSANLPASLDEIKAISQESLIYDLTESGIKSNVIEAIEMTLIDNVKSGNSFNEMATQIKTLLADTATKNGGKLASYSTQIVTDSLYQYVGNYDKLVGQAFKTKWYKYVGSTIDTTRPLCDHLVGKKYIHESELKGIVDGRVDGQQISVAGQIPGTTASNFIVNRGGYNCRHRMIPVPEASVPKDLKEKFKDK